MVVKESFVFLSSLTVSLEPGEINVGCMSCQLCCEAPQGSPDDGNIVRERKMSRASWGDPSQLSQRSLIHLR